MSMAIAWASAASAQVDLSVLDDGMKGPRAQVLVLGTMHLSAFPDGFKPESLEPVLARLAAFKPDVITIEGISGEGCDLMARHPAVYGADAMAYCRHTDEAKRATGLDVPAAIARVKSTLAGWPAEPTPAQRRQLAALFLAANERASALVQWLRLPEAERRAGDGLDQALVAMLDELRTRRNENYLVAAPLAARLGLERVFAVDDHTGDNIAIDDEEAYAKAVRGAWDSAKAQSRPIREREDALSKGEDMLAAYRHANSPEMLRTAVAVDFGAAMRDPSPQHYGQRYVAGWEGRNLRMVANIRAAFRDHPGARVLVVVGSSHKPWFDNLLGTLLGVDLVDAEQVLRQPAPPPTPRALD
ncbi:MAG TPA: DUF5694 domain-containing protein [Dokdonella sp.]